jgi:cell fate regulator YaaT (PSP1 superfamily)
VDFRELVKDLASVFRTRIELRQIGVRDEAKMLGGLGICGKPFCCSTFLDEFQPVSIKMAKEQSLSLNPTKISGTCGRLMCCLKYEQDSYEDLLKNTPRVDSVVKTPDGRGVVTDVNLLRGIIKVALEPDGTIKTYHRVDLSVLKNAPGKRRGKNAEQTEDELPDGLED